MNETLILNDGTELTGHAFATETRLVVTVYGMTMDEVYQLMKEPEKTKTIKADLYGRKETYKGFKHLYMVSEETSGAISAGLKK